jgi:hypothetical protein
MGTFVAELPSSKLHRAMSYLNQRISMLREGPKEEYGIYVVHSQVLHDLLLHTYEQCVKVEDADKKGIIPLKDSMSIWSVPISMAAVILGEDMNGEPTDPEGNLLKL